MLTGGKSESSARAGGHEGSDGVEGDFLAEKKGPCPLQELVAGIHFGGEVARGKDRLPAPDTVAAVVAPFRPGGNLRDGEAKVPERLLPCLRQGLPAAATGTERGEKALVEDDRIEGGQGCGRLPEIGKPAQDAPVVTRVEGAEDAVSCARGLEGHFSGFPVPDFPDKEAVGGLAQKGLQGTRKIKPGRAIDVQVVNPGEDPLDRILDGEDFFVRRDGA